MRGIATKDVPKAARLIRLSGIREEAKNMFDMIRNGKEFELTTDAGFDFLMSIICRFDDQRIADAFCDFVSGPLEISPEDVYEMDVLSLYDLILDWTKTISSERWRAFFTLLFKMIKAD